MLDPVLQTFQRPVALIQESKSVKGKRSGAASSKRQREKRKAAGLCTYFGCSAKPQPNRQYCTEHLGRMLTRQKKIVDDRKRKGLCTYCGLLPQFWGRRCIICRQSRAKNPLPFAARRALRFYREAERKFELELLQVQTRFEIRKLLATGAVTGSYAKALRLYAAIDRDGFRTYDQVGKIMRLTKERVRQLLKPSKIILEEMGDVSWKRVTASAGARFPRRAYTRRCKGGAAPNSSPSTRSKNPIAEQ